MPRRIETTGYFASVLRMPESDLINLMNGCCTCPRPAPKKPKYKAGDYVKWNKRVASDNLAEKIEKYGDGEFEVRRVMMPEHPLQSAVAEIFVGKTEATCEETARFGINWLRLSQKGLFRKK